jgi:hypothetical protein
MLELMENTGPCLSTELTSLLVEKHGLSAEAARKRVSRGCPGLKRLAYLPFPRKARFLYLQQDYRSQQYWASLKEAILSSSSAYAPAYAALLQRGGIIPKVHFPIACGAPLRQKKHLSSDTILSRLKLANIIDEIEVPGVGICIVLAEASTSLDRDYSRLKARLITEAILLKAIRMWARNLGLVSFDKVELRDESETMPRVGTFAWDLTGPSYLAHMVDWGKEGKLAPGFIACDVLLDTKVTELGLRPFLHKCATLRNLKRVGRCFSMFVADSYSKDAFRKAKESGIVPATPETLFGTEVAQGLMQLTKVLTDAARASIKPEVFAEMFQRLGKIEGAATNLRGALFEYIAADLVRQTISASVTLNKIFRDDTGTLAAEVDVLAVEGKRAVYFIECKGYQPSGTVEDDEVEQWLTKRIPIVRQHALRHPEWKSLELHFEFWTTGKLSENAEARIKHAKASTSKYIVEYRDADGVYAYAQGTKDPSLIRILKQHFLEHPMATAERDVKARADKQERDSQRRLLHHQRGPDPDSLIPEPLAKGLSNVSEVKSCPELLDLFG